MKVSVFWKTCMCVMMVAVVSVEELSAKPADAEEINVRIKDIRVEDTVYTPYYLVQTEQDHQQGAAQKWLRLGVYFTTEGGWIDELQIRQMANFEGPEGQNVVLAETERYINLNPGDHYVYMYLHPSYVERYKIDSSEVDNAAFIMINGKELAHKESTREKSAGWSRKENGDTERGYLLNHAETPFWFINYDFKEIIKH